MKPSDVTLSIQQRTDSPSSVLSLFIGLLCVAVLVAHAYSFLPFISDDAFISLRYSERLLGGKGLTWTEGPRVEGYTNLLWVLACAALGLAGADLIDASRAWGFVGMSAAIGAIAYAYRPRRPREALVPMAGGLGMALAAPVAVWTIGGMEQPFVAAFLAWATVLAYPLIAKPDLTWRNMLVPSLFLGLLCLTRSDGGVLCIGLSLGLLASRGLSMTSVRAVAGLAVFPAVMGGGQLIFRLLYYHEWLPNPAHVKVAFTLDRVGQGLRYVSDAAPYLSGLLIPAVLVVILGLFVMPAPRRTTFLAIQLVTWTAYLVVIGGDIFPAHRHWVPSVIFAALMLAELTAWFLDKGDAFRHVAWIAVGLPVLLLGAMQRFDPEVQRAVEERWEWDGQIVGEMLRKAFGAADPLIACDPAGCIPYFTKFRAIDMMGLNDYHIARSKSTAFGRGLQGHELGDGKYVLDREPDLVLWTLPTGANVPRFPSAVQMSQDPRFSQFYRLVILAATRAGNSPTSEGEAPGEPVVCGIFLRAASERVGIRSSPDRLVMPGVLAATSFQTPATLDEQGRLGVVARSQSPAVMPGLGVPPGRWRVVAESDVPARTRMKSSDTRQIIAEGVSELVVDARRDGALVDVELSPVATPAVHVRQLVFFPQP